MRFDQPRYLRQSMSWLHTWSGLLLGWLLFAIFVTGTLSFFRSEITLWMQPELHRAHHGEQALTHAQTILEREAANSPAWFISLPGPRNPTLSLMWQTASTRTANDAVQSSSDRTGLQNTQRQNREADNGKPVAPGAREGASAAPQQRQQHGHGRQNMKHLILDPASGEILKPRETAGGNFLYRFHFELYGIDRLWGRWIVGIATMFMLIAIVTGVIVHRNIFKDFFTFRPAKGKRSWLDAHNASSVLSLPFHFVITFSGLLLLSAILMPSAIDKAYNGDFRAFSQDLRGRSMSEAEPPAGYPAPLGSLSSLRTAAEQQWSGKPVGSITVTNPGDIRARVEMRLAHGSSLANRGMAERITFDGVTGEMLEMSNMQQPSAILSAWNAMGALHLGRFASPVPRWLLFLAGIGGSLMIATGMVMWVVSRFKDREKLGRTPFGHRLVEILNISGIAGLLIATGAYFWANRLLPVDLANRSSWEIQVFFIVWGMTLIHALLRRHKTAWIEQLGLAGLLCMTLPLLNGATGGLHLGNSLVAGQWQVASFDLCALAFGAMLLIAARKVYLHKPRVRTNPGRKPAATANISPPSSDGHNTTQPLFVKLQTEETS